MTWNITVASVPRSAFPEMAQDYAALDLAESKAQHRGHALCKFRRENTSSPWRSTCYLCGAEVELSLDLKRSKGRAVTSTCPRRP